MAEFLPCGDEHTNPASLVATSGHSSKTEGKAWYKKLSGSEKTYVVTRAYRHMQVRIFDIGCDTLTWPLWNLLGTNSKASLELQILRHL